MCTQYFTSTMAVQKSIQKRIQQADEARVAGAERTVEAGGISGDS